MEKNFEGKVIRNFVRSWIQEIKGSGIRINVLSPGAIDTPSLRTA